MEHTAFIVICILAISCLVGIIILKVIIHLHPPSPPSSPPSSDDKMNLDLIINYLDDNIKWVTTVYQEYGCDVKKLPREESSDDEENDEGDAPAKPTFTRVICSSVLNYTNALRNALNFFRTVRYNVNKGCLDLTNLYDPVTTGFLIIKTIPPLCKRSFSCLEGKAAKKQLDDINKSINNVMTKLKAQAQNCLKQGV